MASRQPRDNSFGFLMPDWIALARSRTTTNARPAPPQQRIREIERQRANGYLSTCQLRPPCTGSRTHESSLRAITRLALLVRLTWPARLAYAGTCTYSQKAKMATILWTCFSTKPTMNIPGTPAPVSAGLLLVWVACGLQIRGCRQP